MENEKKMRVENKWTCRCSAHVRVEGAVEGTKEAVVDWMQSHFPGLREAEEGDVVEVWRHNYKGGVVRYQIVGGDYSGEYLYLVEKIGESTKEEAMGVLAEMNAISDKTPIAGDDEEFLMLLEKLRSLGWEALTDKITKRGGKMYAQYRLADPDSQEAMGSSPHSSCLGDCARENGGHTGKEG